jgi:3-hydroxyacyl-[acyl-carrier-protein] dehydratase
MRFLLVDRIHEIEPGRRITGDKLAAMSEDYFEWHFPERPIVPGMLILEACVQLAGWLEAKTSDFERFLLLERVASARYYNFAGPGDRIELELQQVQAEGARRVFQGETRVGEKRGAVIEFEARAVPLAELEDPIKARRTFESLCGLVPGSEGGRG